MNTNRKQERFGVLSPRVAGDRSGTADTAVAVRARSDGLPSPHEAWAEARWVLGESNPPDRRQAGPP